jgi:diacylglycerol kinase family enzyme
MAAEVRNLKETTYTITTESDTFTVTGVMLAIANARKYGTGAAINAVGSPFDGLMEIEIIKEVNTKLLLTAGMSIFSDYFAESEFIEVVSCKEASITCEEPTPFQIDGEYMGERTHVDVKVIPGAIHLIQP